MVAVVYEISKGSSHIVKRKKICSGCRRIGTPTWKIIFRHIVPNTVSPVIVQASMDMGGVILTVASQFLGLGIQPPGSRMGSYTSCSKPSNCMVVQYFSRSGNIHLPQTLMITRFPNPKTRKN